MQHRYLCNNDIIILISSRSDYFFLHIDSAETDLFVYTLDIISVRTDSFSIDVLFT